MPTDSRDGEKLDDNEEMDEEEAQEVYNGLVEVLRDNDLLWIVDEAQSIPQEPEDYPDAPERRLKNLLDAIERGLVHSLQALDTLPERFEQVRIIQETSEEFPTRPTEDASWEVPLDDTTEMSDLGSDIEEAVEELRRMLG